MLYRMFQLHLLYTHRRNSGHKLWTNKSFSHVEFQPVWIGILDSMALTGKSDIHFLSNSGDFNYDSDLGMHEVKC